MEPGVVAELGMEGRHQDGALAAEDRAAVDRGQHLDVVADRLDDRRPDEHGVHGRRRPTAGHLQVGLEGVDLAPEGIAPHGDVDAPKLRWSARPSRISRPSRIMPAHVPKAGMPPARRPASGVEQAGRLEQHRHRRRLAARQDERVDVSSWAGARTATGQRRGAPACRHAGRAPPAGRARRPCRRGLRARLGAVHLCVGARTWGPRHCQHDATDCTGPVTNGENRRALRPGAGDRDRRISVHARTRGKIRCPRPRRAATAAGRRGRHVAGVRPWSPAPAAACSDAGLGGPGRPRAHVRAGGGHVAALRGARRHRGRPAAACGRGRVVDDRRLGVRPRHVDVGGQHVDVRRRPRLGARRRPPRRQRHERGIRRHGPRRRRADGGGPGRRRRRLRRRRLAPGRGRVGARSAPPRPWAATTSSGRSTWPGAERARVVAGGETTWGEVRARLWFSSDGEEWEAVDGGPGGVFDTTGEESVREVVAVRRRASWPWARAPTTASRTAWSGSPPDGATGSRSRRPGWAARAARPCSASTPWAAWSSPAATRPAPTVRASRWCGGRRRARRGARAPHRCPPSRTTAPRPAT